jgi:hypothetical protein
VRGDAGPFDIAINGDSSGAGQPAGALARYEQAGATWWVELCSDTPEQERDRIRQGPPGHYL